MKIVVFGSGTCKYCKYQVNHLSKTFEDDDWLYIDLKENRDALKIAEDISIENIPSIVILNTKYQEIFRKDGGIIPPDQIFNKLSGGNKNIPFQKKYSNLIKSGQLTHTLLTYNPELNSGDIIQARTYSGNKIGKIIIKDCQKTDLVDIESNFGRQTVNDYLDRGGRNDWAWLVLFEIAE